MGKKRIAADKFHVGDEVIVSRRSPNDETWTSGMDETIGWYGKVLTIDGDYVYVEVYPDDFVGRHHKWWYLNVDLTNINCDGLDDVPVGDVIGFLE